MKKFLAIAVIACVMLAACGIAAAADGKYVASKGSDKFHLATCPMVAKIAPENKVTFATKAEAKKAGYTPCQICMPATTPVAPAAAPAPKEVPAAKAATK